jgi:prepilin-type N-terminal cleavage/methylation domain-containing protein
MARTEPMTTSETGERGGFTLIEILLVVALIGLVSWILIGGSTALMSDKTSPDEQFWKATAAARKEALEGGRTVILTYDDKAKGFVLSDGAQKRTLAVTGADDLVIDFHPVQSDSSSSSLIGGTLVETEPLAAVAFYNDGTCTAFRAQLRSGGGAHILSVDPWTCAPVLSKSDATP